MSWRHPGGICYTSPVVPRPVVLTASHSELSADPVAPHELTSTSSTRLNLKSSATKDTVVTITVPSTVDVDIHFSGGTQQ